MYEVYMFFYKEGIKYKEAEVKNLNYAKDVDDKIVRLIDKEYGITPFKSSVKYIYDTINNPKKTEYLDENHKIEYNNDKFYYDANEDRYFNEYKYKDRNKLDYVCISVSKGR